MYRIDGGSHDASNLVLACSSCHQAHHAGALTISGTADHIEVRRPANDAHVGAPANANADPHVDAAAKAGAHVGAPTKLDVAIIRTQSKDALIGLGWKPAIAHAAVAAASAALGTGATLERLIFEALRRCPQPTI